METKCLINKQTHSKGATEGFSIWHDVLKATDDEWIAEKTRILLILEKIKENEKFSSHSHILSQMQQILIDHGDSEDRHLSIEEYLDELAFCYPKLREPNYREVFLNDADERAHIRPDLISDLTELKCPHCKSNLESIDVSKEFDLKAAGCKHCNRLFTPREIIQIRYLQKK